MSGWIPVASGADDVEDDDGDNGPGAGAAIPPVVHIVALLLVVMHSVAVEAWGPKQTLGMIAVPVYFVCIGNRLRLELRAHLRTSTEWSWLRHYFLPSFVLPYIVWNVFFNVGEIVTGAWEDRTVLGVFSPLMMAPIPELYLAVFVLQAALLAPLAGTFLERLSRKERALLYVLFLGGSLYNFGLDCTAIWLYGERHIVDESMLARKPGLLTIWPQMTTLAIFFVGPVLLRDIGFVFTRQLDVSAISVKFMAAASAFLLHALILDPAGYSEWMTRAAGSYQVRMERQFVSPALSVCGYFLLSAAVELYESLREASPPLASQQPRAPGWSTKAGDQADFVSRYVLAAEYRLLLAHCFLANPKERKLIQLLVHDFIGWPYLCTVVSIAVVFLAVASIVFNSTKQLASALLRSFLNS